MTMEPYGLIVAVVLSNGKPNDLSIEYDFAAVAIERICVAEKFVEIFGRTSSNICYKS